MKQRKGFIFIIISFMVLISFVYAATGDLETTLVNICNSLFDIIPSIAFLLVATAAVVYAAGNLMTSEMRARAHVWAMSCLVGAIIGGVILMVVPTLLGALIKAGGITPSNLGSLNGSCGDRIKQILS